MFKKIILLYIFIFVVVVCYGQRFMVISGENYPKADTVQYYLPDNINDTSLYPSVILLHGYGGSYRQWSSICKMQQLSNEFGMILICLDGFKDSFYIDSPLKSDEKFATFFRESLIPELKKSLPLDTKMMFISGLSMGGHGALYLMLQNPGVFRAAGSMSGVVDLKASSVAKTCLVKHLGSKTSDNKNWELYSCVGNINRIKEAGCPIIVNCGAQDFLIEANRKFARKCADAGIDIVYMESPGKHERSYWQSMLPEQLRFFRKFINKTLY